MKFLLIYVPNLRFTNNQLKDFKIVDICKLKQGNQYDLKQQFTEEKSDLKRFIRIIDYTQKTNDIRYVYSNGSENYVDCTDVVVVRYGASAGYVGRGINGIIANNLGSSNIEMGKKWYENIIFSFIYAIISMKVIY